MSDAIAQFLADLTQANRSPHTYRAYATELARFSAAASGQLADLTTEAVRTFLATRAHLSPASRARTHAALTSLFHWAVRQDLIAANPMDKLDPVRIEPPRPRAVDRAQIAVVLKVIPRVQLRDRLFFRLLAETGLRVSEALAVYVDDLDLTRDDEHLRVVGKGRQPHTVFLDDPVLVKELRTYLAQTGYQYGLLFRALKNGDGGPLRYQTMQERWARYCALAGVTCTLHQLRHSHATELVNGGVSIVTIRKRLGHKRIQTTLRYAEQADRIADAEIRLWRRHHSQQR